MPLDAQEQRVAPAHSFWLAVLQQRACCPNNDYKADEDLSCGYSRSKRLV